MCRVVESKNDSLDIHNPSRFASLYLAVGYYFYIEKAAKSHLGALDQGTVIQFGGGWPPAVDCGTWPPGA